MKGLQIEKAAQANMPQLAHFARETYTAAYGADLEKSFLNEHLQTNMSDAAFSRMLDVDTFYRATYQSNLIAYIQIGVADPFYSKFLDQFDSAGFEIRRLYVLDRFQNHGIGNQLIQQALNDPNMASAQTIYLTTWESNFGAQRLYQKHNFEKVGQFPEVGNNGELNGYEHIFARRNHSKNFSKN